MYAQGLCNLLGRRKPCLGRASALGRADPDCVYLWACLSVIPLWGVCLRAGVSPSMAQEESRGRFQWWASRLLRVLQGVFTVAPGSRSPGTVARAGAKAPLCSSPASNTVGALVMLGSQGMADGTNDKAAGNTASSFTVRHSTQELRGWCFCRGGEGCRRHGRAGHPYAATVCGCGIVAGLPGADMMPYW